MPGAIFNIGAQRRWPKGERQGRQRIKNCQEQFLTLERSDDGPKGERHGWQRIKNYLEQFLTLERSDDGPKGERQGWQRITKAP